MQYSSEYLHLKKSSQHSVSLQFKHFPFFATLFPSCRINWKAMLELKLIPSRKLGARSLWAHDSGYPALSSAESGQSCHELFKETWTYAPSQQHTGVSTSKAINSRRSFPLLLWSFPHLKRPENSLLSINNANCCTSQLNIAIKTKCAVFLVAEI